MTPSSKAAYERIRDILAKEMSTMDKADHLEVIGELEADLEGYAMNARDDEPE